MLLNNVPLCKNCKWVSNRQQASAFWVCLNAHLISGVDPLEGKPVRPLCIHARQDPNPFGGGPSDYCGPEGRLFEKKD